MKKLRGISIVLILATLLQLFTGIVSFAENETKTEQENYPVWYLRENFGSASSWDKARAWNGTNYNTGSGVNGVELVGDIKLDIPEEYATKDYVNQTIQNTITTALEGEY